MSGDAAGLTIVFIADIHGHLVPRPDVLRPGTPTIGGLARVATIVASIRHRAPEALLVNVGDTIQGSLEALRTRGEALASTLDLLGIDAFVPGNWDFLYGTERFLELFAGPSPRAAWGATAANLYFDGEPYEDRSGARPLPPYRLLASGGVRIALIGITTHRGPQAVGPGVTAGFRFTDGEVELAELVRVVREREAADLVVLGSELGLARNLELATAHAGIDVVLSADTHEVTPAPVVVDSGSVVVEPGQDGAFVGELRLARRGGRWAAEWTLHDTAGVAEDPIVARHIERMREPYRSELTSVAGDTAVALHRASSTTDPWPAVLEGTSHDLIADALRATTGADVAALRGFRFGTHVRPGPVTLEDLHHFLPLGSLVASGLVSGRAIREQLERSAHGCLAADPREWTGGWLFAYSGLRVELDPLGPEGGRVRSAQIQAEAGEEPLCDDATYRYASLYHAEAPDLLNGLEAEAIEVACDDAGAPVEAVSAVSRHLADGGGTTGRLAEPRIRPTGPLPPPAYGFPELQPLHARRSRRSTAR